MKRARLVFAALLAANPLLAQTRTPVEGVWRIVEWVEAGRTYSTVQPSLFVFTKSHYSMAFLQTFQPRPPVAPPQVRQNLTDAEKIARFEDWRPFSASSGTYQVRDSTIELRAMIAKSRWEMGEQAVQSVTFRMEGSDTVRVAFAPALGIRVKLVRVE